MTQLTTIQETILSKAYENHTRDRREIPTWRVCVRAPFNERPVESSEEVELVGGFTRGDWLRFRDVNAAINSIAASKRLLDEYLKSHFPKEINWGYTNTLASEIFFELGFLFVMSHQFYVKSKAEALMKEWQAQGLDCFIHPELPEGADLYSYEALEEKYKKQIQTGHLSFPGDSHRTPGGIETALRGKRKDSIAKARDQVNGVFEALEGEGLAIHVKGRRLFREWDGLSLTDAGLRFVEKLKEGSMEEPRPKIIPPNTELLKCLSCARIYYQVTEKFNPEVECNGLMFELLPQYGPGGSNWDSYNLNDSGENLTCPGCGALYTNPAGFLREGALVKAEDHPEASSYQ